MTHEKRHTSKKQLSEEEEEVCFYVFERSINVFEGSIKISLK